MLSKPLKEKVLAFLVAKTKKLKNVLFPKKCLICFTEGEHFCKQHKKFSPNQQKPKKYLYLDMVFATANYDDFVNKRLIEYFKFNGFRDLSETIAHEIVKKKSADFFMNTVLIPIPLHWTRHWWRGFNQALLIANSIQKLVPETTINTSLHRLIKTKQQARLKRIERFHNLKDTFFWKGETTPPKKIILIDDVTTTGATLESAARTLKKAGAKEVIAVVFAQGE